MHIYFTKTTNNNYNSFGILECICETAADTPAKELVEGTTGVALETGLQIKVKFTYGNTVTAPTLTLLTKPIIAGGYLKPEMFSSAGNIMDLLYDGTNWIITGGIYGETPSYQATITVENLGFTGTPSGMYFTINNHRYGVGITSMWSDPRDYGSDHIYDANGVISQPLVIQNIEQIEFEDFYNRPAITVNGVYLDNSISTYTLTENSNIVIYVTWD